MIRDNKEVLPGLVSIAPLSRTKKNPRNVSGVLYKAKKGAAYSRICELCGGVIFSSGFRS